MIGINDGVVDNLHYLFSSSTVAKQNLSAYWTGMCYVHAIVLELETCTVGLSVRGGRYKGGSFREIDFCNFTWDNNFIADKSFCLINEGLCEASFHFSKIQIF